MDYRSRRRRRSFDLVTLSRYSKFIFFGLIAFVVFIFVLFLWFSRDLPTPGKLSNASLAESTRIYDRNGILLYSVYGNQNRIYVTLDKIPKDLRHATIAIEDKEFYKNQGFSIVGYIRSLRNIILTGSLSGGSTLTQQLVKNVLLTSERTISRKIKELILAIQVDKKYTKDQILEMYLNDVSYGGANVGVEAASQAYFGKSVKELNLTESAFLAGLPQAPSVYSPFSGEKYYINRTDRVLTQMVKSNMITQKQKDQALKEISNKKFSQKDTIIKAPHFVMYVKQILSKQFGEQLIENGGLQITTTLDWKIQQEAEKIIKEEIEDLKGYHVGNGAAVVSDPKTGEILAMVGSKDYFDTKNDGNFNAALSNRQPGSSLKPLMYAVSFEKGYTGATMVMDSKTDFPTGEAEHPIYTPVNYDGKYNGPTQLRFALGNSANIPAVKMLAKVGIKDVMKKAHEMGISNWEPTNENVKSVGLSLVLGGRETSLLSIVTSYGVFATGGVRHDPITIQKVLDNKGKTLYENKKTEGRKVLSEEVSFLISHILLDNNARKQAFGPSSWLVIPGKSVSVKTGTTDEKRDNWTIGYTPSFVVGVWVGNNDNSPMNPKIASGITGASPIWNRIMKFVLKGKSDEEPKKPENVTAVMVDSLGGGIPSDGKSTRTEYFIKGTEPKAPSLIYKKLKISKHQNNKLANQEEINRGEYDTKDFIVFEESDPFSTEGKNKWQEGINEWIKKTYAADRPEYYPPTETSDHKYGESSSPTSTPTPTSSQSPTPTLTPTITPTSITPVPTQ